MLRSECNVQLTDPAQFPAPTKLHGGWLGCRVKPFSIFLPSHPQVGGFCASLQLLTSVMFKYLDVGAPEVQSITRIQETSDTLKPGATTDCPTKQQSTRSSAKKQKEQCQCQEITSAVQSDLSFTVMCQMLLEQQKTAGGPQTNRNQMSSPNTGPSATLAPYNT